MIRPVLAAAFAVAALAAAGPVTPAHYRAGTLPALPVRAVSGGQVFLELTIGPSGGVANVTVLRDTPSFTQPMVEAVRSWQFLPAEESIEPAGRQPVTAKVLVAGFFRPPALFQGLTAGEPPKDVASASADTPFPTDVTAPLYPPNALGDGVVLVQVQIDPTGTVIGATVVHAAPPFDEPALAAARQWTFRPARLLGQPVPAVAYLIFGFRQPITA